MSKTADTPYGNEVTVPLSGGSPSPPTAGVPIVRKFPVTFDSPDIETSGVILYVPTVDEILLDAWVEIVEAWDGTTPQGDLVSGPGGFSLAAPIGWFNQQAATLDMTQQDDVFQSTLLQQPNNAETLSDLAQWGVLQGVGNAWRRAPGRFTTVDPVAFLVNENGAFGGGATGAAQGAANVYLVTAVPA